ncbi:hypothetical protein CEP52_004582 [Fusarium oligoseptatum]|uniref:Uncharacterized protein n=1 Tax=Fusarium oligoseptatum TaxID=2604345 RepID=A0A428U2X0_9HYPO|nr:hypothetical protein CEP52_004582 [Fusarium oligoseptatum]
MPPSSESKCDRIQLLMRQWVLANGFDIICMSIVGSLSTLLYHAPVFITRTFPITFDATSGDIIYPEWAYPDRGWIIPSWLSGVISIAGPFSVYLLAQIQIRSVWDASNAIMGTTWSVVLASLFQVALKKLVGGFRPYFLDVCMPDISLAAERNASGLNGVGFHKVMYTTEICTQPDKSKIQKRHNLVSKRSHDSRLCRIRLPLSLAKRKAQSLGRSQTRVLEAMPHVCASTRSSANRWVVDDRRGA